MLAAIEQPGDRDEFIRLHRAFNLTNRRGTTQEECSALAKRAGFKNGQRITWMFSKGILVTRSDGRWVSNL